MGNIISGLIGGIPITQVIVRSSANIQSGGKSKLSAVFHGFLILSFVGFVPELLNLIPRASLAAILLMVGYKLAKPATFKQMWNAGMSQFLPFIITILLILFKDLLWGVSIGLVVAVFEILYINYKKPYQINIEDDAKGRIYHILLTENVTFLNKASIMNTLDNIPDSTTVIVDASRTNYIHPDVEEIIEDFKTHASFSNITLEVIK
jgi:MFS superfamily sulfate permease-like transporter